MGNAPIQMGLKTDKQSYQHGETMTGTVYISVSQVNPTIENYQGIRLQFAGNENTEVRVEERSGDTTTYRTVRESSSILRVEVPMMNFSSPLRVAKYEFPFEWKLPDTPLPSSFRHKVPLDRKGHCEVKYTLTAYLVPQDNTGGFGASLNSSNNNRSSSASQTICFLGAPTRSIPDPINIAEERTVMNGFCCCWKQGHVSLGWEADTIVLTPEAPCHLQIWGSNSSSLPVQCLRVQLIQSVKWQAGNDYGNKRHTRSNNTTLIDYNIDISHLPQWDPVLPSTNRSNRDYQAANQQPPNENGDDDDAPHQPVATSFQVPADVMDSYRGLNCTVEHTLIVTAVTRMMATTPTVSYSVHLQRAAAYPGAAAGSLPVATAWMEEAEYTDAVLPSDWAPDEKVPVIHLREITSMDVGVGMGGNNGTNNHVMATATAQAVIVDPPMNPAATAAGVHPSMAAVAVHPSMMMSAAAHPSAAATMHPSSAPIQSKAAYPPAAPAVVAAYPTAPPTPAAAAPAQPAPISDHTMDFARPAGMTDEIVAASASGATDTDQEQQFTDLQQFQGILMQIDPNDMSTYRRVEQQVRSLPSCQRVLATMTPEDFQFLCQVGTPISIARITYLLATELNRGGQGFRGAFLVALMQLPVAQETSISLIGTLTEQISDLEQSADYVQQQLRPEDAKWFKQRVDDWAY